MSIYSRLDRIAADVEKLDKQVKSVSNAPQSQRTSVEGGSIDFNDADGNLKAIVGAQDDGGTTVNVVAGPTPPTPINYTVTVDHGSLTVHWDGEFENDAVAPTDWARWTAYAQPGEFVVPERSTAIGGTDSASGGEVTAGVLKGQWTVTVLAWSQAGKPSAMGLPVTVDVPGYGDIVLAEIDAAETLIKNAGEILVTEQGTLDEKLSGVDGTLNDLGQDLQAVEDAQAQLNTDLTDVMTSVDGKNTITWNPSAPSKVSSPGKAVGDLWYRTSGNNIIGFWKWDGTDWVTQLLDKTTIPLIDIGTGTFGSMSGSRLDVGSVAADRVLVGAGQNLLPWAQVLSGRTVLPHFQENYYGAGTLTIGQSDLAKGVPRHIVQTRTSSDSGTNRIIFSFRPGPNTGVNIEYMFAVSGGTWSLSVDAYSDSGAIDAQTQMTWYKADGSYGGASYGALVGLTQTPKKVSGSVALPSDAAYMIPYIRTNKPGVTHWVNPVLAPAVGSTLIEPGAITTPKLAADVLEVRNLKATSGQLDEAVINKLFSDVVVAKTAVANAFIGSNAILDESVTAPKIVASEELWAKLGQFVKVRAEQIESDAIDGMVITGPNIRTAASGARVQLDAGGLSVYDSLDDWQVRLTPDGSSFKGDLEAESLVANGAAEFKSTDNMLAQGAKLTLAAGVTDPTAPPIVQPYWDGIEFTPTEGKTYYGLAFAGGKYWTFEDAPKSSDGDRVVSIDPATGAIGDAIPMTDNFWAAGGVTAIGSELFLLGPKSGTDYKYFVRVYSTAGVFLREWEYVDIGWSKTNQLVYKPGIGSNGTNVVIAQCDDLGSLRWRTYNKTTGAFISEVNANDATKSDISGIYIGAADHGGGTFATIAKTATRALPSFTMSGVYAPERSWRMADDANEIGIVFADGKFRTLNASGVIREYADGGTGDGSGDWWCAYRWETDVNSDGMIDYRSKIGPPARFTWPRRARLKATGQPRPVGVELMAGFLAKKATRPSRTDFKRNYTAYSITRSIAYWDWYQNTGDAPSDGNNYPTATPSSVASASGTFQVNGDGSGKWGPLTFNPDGTMSSSAVPAWIPITAFLNSWGVGDLGFAPAYRVWPDGKVEWRGVVKGPAATASKPIINIPTNARPAQYVPMGGACNGGGGSPGWTRIDVNDPDAANIIRLNPQIGSVTWASLDLIEYYKN